MYNMYYEHLLKTDYRIPSISGDKQLRHGSQHLNWKLVLVFTCVSEGESRSRNRFLRPSVCRAVRPSVRARQYLLSV